MVIDDRFAFSDEMPHIIDIPYDTDAIVFGISASDKVVTTSHSREFLRLFKAEPILGVLFITNKFKEYVYEHALSAFLHLEQSIAFRYSLSCAFKYFKVLTPIKSWCSQENDPLESITPTATDVFCDSYRFENVIQLNTSEIQPRDDYECWIFVMLNKNREEIYRDDVLIPDVLSMKSNRLVIETDRMSDPDPVEYFIWPCLQCGEFLDKHRYPLQIAWLPGDSVPAKSIAKRKYRTFVINLEKLSDRKEYIKQAFPQNDIHDYEFFSGIDGDSHDWSLEPINFQYYYGEQILMKTPRTECDPYVYTNPGMFGCLKSHANLFQKIVDEKIDVALVFEDDIVLNMNQNEIDEFYESLPDDWDLAYLSWRDDSREELKAYGDFKILRFPVYGSGYFVTNRAASILLDRIYPIRYAIDACMGRTVYWRYLRAYGVKKPMKQHSHSGKFHRTTLDHKETDFLTSLRSNKRFVDALIIAKTKEPKILERCISGCRRYVKNVRRIFVISDEKYVECAEWLDQNRLFNKQVGFTEEKDRIRECVAEIIPGLAQEILLMDSNTIFSETNRYDEDAS